MVTGMDGACGKIKRTAKFPGSCNSGTMGAKSCPSAPRPCSQIIVASGLFFVSISIAGSSAIFFPFDNLVKSCHEVLRWLDKNFGDRVFSKSEFMPVRVLIATPSLVKIFNLPGFGSCRRIVERHQQRNNNNSPEHKSLINHFHPIEKDVTLQKGYFSAFSKSEFMP